MEAKQNAVATYGDAVVAAMAEAGVAALFYTSGSDIPFYPEAIAKREALGLPAPVLYSIPHEIVSMNMALGYAAFSGKPVATAAHVALGTLNYGSAVHTALRSHLPVLITAGMPPTSTPGTIPGGRDGVHFWEQQVPDQNGIVRQFCKWDHMLNYLDNPGSVVSRAVQVAVTEPRGPVYLSIPREVQQFPIREESFATLSEIGVGRVGEPDAETAHEVVDLLIKAQNPVVVVGAGGRNAQSLPYFTEFVETFGVRVVDGPLRGYTALDYSHPQYQHLAGDLSDVDLVIVLEQDLPWMPGDEAPQAQAPVIWVDPDPIVMKMKLIDYHTKLRIMSDAQRFSQKILAVAQEKLTEPVRQHLAEVRAASEAKVAAFRASEDQAGRDAYKEDHIDPEWAAHVIASRIPSDALVLDDTVDSAPIFRFLRLTGPGRYLQNQSSSGGYGIGAVVGAKLAQPDRPAVMLSGDGFYMFGVPSCALWAARAHAAPFLGIVFQNDSYNTGTEAIDYHYPDGYAATSGYPGGSLHPGLDFALEAQAAGAYGENVFEPSQLTGALDRAWAAIEGGQAAILSIRTPRLGDHADNNEERTPKA